MIYLDNAATTHKKPLSVIFATLKAITSFNANPGRGGHKLSIKAGMEVFKTRETLNKMFNGYGENYCIFTQNCTDGLNLAILGSELPKGSHVITTMFEHNSVLRPLTRLKNDNKIELTIISPKNVTGITVNEIESRIKENTKMIVVSHISNVLGSETNLYEIGKICKQKNIIFIVDAAQSGGHKKIDIKKSNISALSLAAHKGLFGIMGTSALLISDNIKLQPIRFGGTGTHSKNLSQNFEAPEVFESGTQGLPGILALNSGAKFAMKHMQKNEEKTTKLSKLLYKELAVIPKIKIYSKTLNGVIAFNIANVPSSEVADYLNSKGICVRAGFQCAPLTHEYLKTGEQGVVRVSLNFFNKKSHIKKLVTALTKFIIDL